MIEELIEEIIGLAFEGAIEGSKNSRLPKPVRYILRFVVFAVFAAVIGLFVLITVSSFRDGNTAMGIFMIALIALLAGAAAFKVVKLLKRK